MTIVIQIKLNGMMNNFIFPFVNFSKRKGPIPIPIVKVKSMSVATDSFPLKIFLAISGRSDKSPAPINQNQERPTINKPILGSLKTNFKTYIANQSSPQNHIGCKQSLC